MSALPDLPSVVTPRHEREAGARPARVPGVDALTGLPDRAASLSRLAAALDLAAGAPVAVLVIDLDRFRLVNDSLGHSAGDMVLTEQARRLREVVRPTDTVGRLSGDEFLVVCGRLEGEVDAVGLSDRLRRALAEPVSIGSQRVTVTASVGIVREAGVRPEDVVRDAGLAASQAQERGGNRVEVFGRRMRARRVRRMEIERDLREAMQHGRLNLHYQPGVRLGDGTPTLVEALLRWDRGGEPISPAEFVAVAEDAGLIVELGRWALLQACREVASWGRRNPALASVRVAVNLSARQFADEGLVDTVARVLEATRLEPSRLWLEITETALMADADSTVETLVELKGLGVGLAVDDFGTGYSSLAYLRHFPVDVLKIDASFVADLDRDEHDPLVAAVVQLAHALGLGVVAEGVETERQRQRLRALACDHAQGYLYSPALPGTAAQRWLEHRLAPRGQPAAS